MQPTKTIGGAFATQMPTRVYSNLENAPLLDLLPVTEP